MKEYLVKNYRIFLSIILSLIIVFFIVPIFATPGKIKNLLSNIKFNPNSLIKLFTIKFESKPKEPELVSRLDNRNNSFSLTPIPQTTSIPVEPTGQSRPTPTIRLYPTNKITPTIKVIPTKIPTKVPTSIPKPTKVPPPPPVTSDIRPGNSLEEIFDNVSKRMCIPAALLRAFQEGETGAWFHFDTDPTPYNTYGWWTTAGPDPCRGFGYDAKTGYVPSDSYYAGKFCMITPGANPGIMGLFAIDQWEQDVSRKNTIAILPNNIDRRVIFDSVVIFTSITVNRVGSNELPACGEQWSDTAVNIAAAKHVSGTYPCLNQTCEKYSRSVLERYKQYSK